MQEQWIKELNKVFKFTIKVAKWLIKSEQAIIRQKIHRHCETNKVELSRKMFDCALGRLNWHQHGIHYGNIDCGVFKRGVQN